MSESARPRNPTSTGLEAYRIQQVHKTLRVCTIAICVLIGLTIIAAASVVIAINEVRWENVVLTVFATLTVSSVPIWGMTIRFRTYMANDHQRIVELESRFDSTRTTSALSKKGDYEGDELLDN